MSKRVLITGAACGIGERHSAGAARPRAHGVGLDLAQATT